MSVYKIDNVAVNDRTDWHSLPVIGDVTDQRSEGFPGYGGRFITKGQGTADGIEVEGVLEASSRANLFDQIRDYAAMRRGRSLHRVTFQGESDENMHLEAVTLSRPYGFLNGAGVWKLGIRIRFVWRGVEAGAGS